MSRRPTLTGPKVIRAADSSMTVTQDANGYKLASSATGGGGASASNHFVVGSGGEGDSDLSNKIVIPGLSGSVDKRAGGTNDDEFDALSGWTTLGSLDTSNVTDYKSIYHIKKNSGGTQVDGIYKACPTIPFTMTAKMNDFLFNANYQTPGIFIAEASPGKLATWGPQYALNGLELNPWTNRTTRGTQQDFTYAPFNTNNSGTMYLQIVVNSSTNVDFSVSLTGYIFKVLKSAYNPGFTVGSVGVCAISFAAVACEAYFDWVRFT